MVNKDDYNLYFLNDSYDDEIIRDMLASFRTRLYSSNLNSTKYAQNILVKNGTLIDIRMNKELNERYDLPGDSYSLHFNRNIIPFYSEKDFIDKYGYDKVISSVDVMNDDEVFDKNIFFFIGDYMIYDIKLIVRKQECIIIIPVETDETASNLCLEHLFSLIENEPDSSWTIMMTRKGDYYYTYSPRNILFNDNKIYLSNFTTKKIYPKKTKENCWTLYLTYNNLSKNIMCAADTTLASDANGQYFTVPEEFKAFISQSSNMMKCLIINEPDCSGKGTYMYSENTRARFQIPFKKNPIPVENFIVWKYDSVNKRKCHPMMNSIQISYPNIYDFSEMSTEDYQIYLLKSSRNMVIIPNKVPIVRDITETTETNFDLHISWMESVTYSINHYESYVNDYITYCGDKYSAMVLNGTLHPVVQEYAPITNDPYTFDQYLKSPYFMDHRAWMLDCLIKLLNDNPLCYDELYCRLYSKNKKFITRTFTYETAPHVYERSVRNNKMHCDNADERITYFDTDHTYIQMFNHTCKNRACTLYINGVRRHESFIMTFGSTMYVYFPVSYIANHEDIQIDVELENDDIITKTMIIDSGTSVVDFGKLNFTKPNSLSNLWFYDDDTKEVIYLDGIFDAQLKILTSYIKYDGSDIVDTLTHVEDTRGVSNPDYQVISTDRTYLDLTETELESHKKINLNNIQFILLDKSLINSNIVITNTNYYRRFIINETLNETRLYDANVKKVMTASNEYILLVRNEDTDNESVFFMYNFKGNHSSLWFRVYYEGRLINPNRCTFLFTERHDYEAQLFIEELNENGEVVIEYIGHDEEIVYNGTIGELKTVGSDIISLDDVISTPFDLYAYRLYIDGYRVHNNCISIIGQSTMIMIDKLKFDITDESEFIVFKQINDYDPYEFSTEKDKLSTICKDDEEFRNYMISKYKK